MNANEQSKTQSTNGKVFRCEGFGLIGEANLLWFVPNSGQKNWRDLEIGEGCFGVANGKPEHIVRVE